MRVCSISHKNNRISFNQKQTNVEPKKEFMNYRTPRSCNHAFFGLAGAIVSSIFSGKITQKIIQNTNTKAHPLSIHARVSFGIMALGFAIAGIINKVDKDGTSKISQFTTNLFNNPQKLINKEEQKTENEKEVKNAN